MAMPGRKYTKPNSGYRYGFNGKENDNEVKGEGNQQDYGMRIYDPRLGKFLSVDPLTQEYPWYTPYQFAGNTPITAVDIDGLEPDKSLNSNEARVTPAPVTLSPSPTRIGPGGNFIKPYTPRPSIWGSGFKLLAGLASSPITMTIAGVLIPSNMFEKSSESGWLENRDLESRERAEDKYEEEHPKDEIRYVTYYKIGKNDEGEMIVYSGRTSGPAKLTAEQIVEARNKQHELVGNLKGFSPAIIDKEAVGGLYNPGAKWAIRGREQQLIDRWGGAQSDKGTSANKIRGVSRINPNGLVYHTSSTIAFKQELHEFTGFKMPKLR
jgi:RHS repeat-associated protein